MADHLMLLKQLYDARNQRFFVVTQVGSGTPVGIHVWEPSDTHCVCATLAEAETVDRNVVGDAPALYV